MTFPIFPNKISNSIRTPSICLRFKGEGDWRCIACDGPMDGALCEDSRNDFFSSINKERINDHICHLTPKVENLWCGGLDAAYEPD